MVDDARLNILLTHAAARSPRTAGSDEARPWYELLGLLLAPLGVRTYEATDPSQAVHLIEQYPIHLAVIDTRLSAVDQLGLLRLLSQLRQCPLPAPAAPTPPGQVRVEVRGEPAQKIPVRRPESRRSAPSQTVWPTVIVVTPARDDQLLTQALKFDAFSVLPEPVDVNLMLDMMARALKRFHHNLWPQ